MCGIAGLLDLSRSGHRSDLASRAGAMAQAIAYRGPDGADVWSDAEARRCAGAPAARHHRSHADRRATDDVRRRALGNLL